MYPNNRLTRRQFDALTPEQRKERDLAELRARNEARRAEPITRGELEDAIAELRGELNYLRSDINERANS